MPKTILDGVSSVAYTGGTSVNFIETRADGQGTQYVRTGQTGSTPDRVRLSGRPARTDSEGNVVAKHKATAVATILIDDTANGNGIRSATMRIEMLVDPRDLASVNFELRRRGCQILTEASWENLFLYGSEA